MIKKLNKIGNSKGVIIDKPILDILLIVDLVEIKIEDNKIIICKPQNKEAS